MPDLANIQQNSRINTAIVEAITDGIIVLDHQMKIQHVNNYALNLLELKNELMLGIPIIQIIPELDGLFDKKILNNDLIKISKSERILTIKLKPSGEDKVIIFIQDSSSAEIQAQQTKLAALGQLTANMAHEIRNPLSAISHACQLLNEEFVADTSAKRTFQIILKNVKRIEQMIKEVLEVNHQDASKIVSINLSLFLKEFHEYFCQVEEIPSSHFQLELSKEQLIIGFNPMHLDQVLWNLCRNGWRYSNKKAASLTLSTSMDEGGKHVLIEISDDGTGISAENYSRMFEPFFTTESSGTGLGLYISRELCLNNQADIHYKKTQQGSKFSIKLQKASA